MSEVTPPRAARARRGRALPAIAAAGLVALAALTGGATAQAGPVDDACRTAAASDSLCIGAGKLGERASAECRRASDTASQGVPSDQQCAMPAGRAVIRSEIGDYVGSWVHRAHRLQYELASDVGLANAPWVGTHNSYNSTAELPTLSHTDSNHQLSIVDQLAIDVRSVEIDVHWFPSARAGGFAPVVCHATGEHAGCTTERLLGEVLSDVAAWLNANPDQVILLYLEDHLDGAEGHAAGAAAVDAALRTPGGDSLVYTPAGPGCNTLPLDLSRDEVRAAGKQVVIVSSCGTGVAWQGLVHDWNPVEVESRPRGYRDVPDCDQDGDGDGLPDFDRATYDTKMVRYFEDSTWLTNTASNAGLASTDEGITPETAARMARCGVDLTGMDQLLPLDGRLEALVWSWAEDEPAATGDCSVQRADGRWRAVDCRRPRPVACRAPDGSWLVPRGRAPYRQARRLCRRAGAVAAVPRTGWENQLLLAANPGTEVWLGQTRSGDAWVPADPAGDFDASRPTTGP